MKLSIKNRGGSTVLRLCFFIVLLSFGISPALAQELVRTPVESSETNVSERVRQLETELERQNLKLDQLQKAIMEQQSTIQALLEKLSAQATPGVTAAKATETTATVTAHSEAVTAETQTPTVEQRLAKVEGQVLKIGAVRI